MIFKENKPIYLQIAERLCDEIIQECYGEESRIPSVREYSATLEVNVNTVVRSYEYLQNASIIYNKRGLGYFVKEGATRAIIAQRKKEFMNEELPEFLNKLKQLDIPIEEIVEKYHSME